MTPQQIEDCGRGEPATDRHEDVGDRFRADPEPEETHTPDGPEQGDGGGGPYVSPAGASLLHAPDPNRSDVETISPERSLLPDRRSPSRGHTGATR
ncbi:hypothetical protein Aab01nite_43070 [Paractinoplanes abujensis]|nr:hypothetical protein Aab01nite_43070 [Actinoplanes abujensis]